MRINYSSGILDPHIKKYRMVRILPCKALRPLVEFLYEISWNMPGGEEQLVESLPAPSVHLVFWDGKAEISGPIERRFSYLMQNQGSIFGAKFRPGAFKAFSDENPATLCDKRIPAERILGQTVVSISKRILSSKKFDERSRILNEYLASIKKNDENILLIRKIFEDIERKKSILTVEYLAATQKMTVRSLQRLFKEYIGVRPKWAIQLFRLREAAEKIESKGRPDLSSLALELGYSDQAHFSNHFKRITGKTPKDYPH